MRLHVLETCEPPPYPVIVLPVDDDPAGLVWQTQQPLVTSTVAELSRWPRLLEIVQRYGVQSYCWLPLTTARRRLGTLVFTSNEPSAYDAADLGFLQQAANQVAVAVENALAFEEIAALKDQLHKEKPLPPGGGPQRAPLRGGRRRERRPPPGPPAGRDGRPDRRHRPDPRGDGHRQGTRRPGPARPEPPPGASIRQAELRGHPDRAAGERAVRPREGRLHRGGRPEGRPVRAGAPGDAVPRRGRRHPARAAAEAAARAAGAGVRAARRHQDDQGGRAAGGRHQPRPGEDGRRGQVPLATCTTGCTSSRWCCRRCGSGRRTSRCWSATSPQRFARRMGRRIETIPTAVMDALVRYPLAGQRAGVAERDRAGGHPLPRSRPSDPARRPAVVRGLEARGRKQRAGISPRLLARRSHWPTPSGSTSSGCSARPDGCWPARGAPRPGWG